MPDKYVPREWVLIDLDLAILSVLPEEGTRLGFTMLATQTKAIVRALNDQLPQDTPREGRVRSDQINGRLRGLMANGYVVSHTVQPVQGGFGYQRTPLARRILSERGMLDGVTIEDMDRDTVKSNPDQ